MLIKEPLFKRANDGIDIIRIENPEDVEFIDSSSFSNLYKFPTYFQLKCHLHSYDPSELRIDLILYENVKLQKNDDIYMKDSNGNWAKGRVIGIETLFEDKYGNER